jgi:hypothetical protein
LRLKVFGFFCDIFFDMEINLVYTSNGIFVFFLHSHLHESKGEVLRWKKVASKSHDRHKRTTISSNFVPKPILFFIIAFGFTACGFSVEMINTTRERLFVCAQSRREARTLKKTAHIFLVIRAMIIRRVQQFKAIKIDLFYGRRQPSNLKMPLLLLKREEEREESEFLWILLSVRALFSTFLCSMQMRSLLSTLTSTKSAASTAFC